jgi:hypothetical protein
MFVSLGRGAGVPVCLMRFSLIPQPKWFQLFHLTPTHFDTRETKS